MDTLLTVTLICTSLVSSRPPRNLIYGPNGGGYVEGYTTHGVNNFNGKLITEYQKFGTTWNTPIYETQVLPFNNKGEAELITPNTDRHRRLATGRNFIDIVKTLPDAVDLDGNAVKFNEISTAGTPFDRPYYESGTLTQLSTDISDRTTPVSFADAGTNPSQTFGGAYVQDTVNLHPTLAEWERGSGIIEIDCDDGEAEVVITVCNLLPEALYTVLDIGVAKPGPDETIYFGPAGGLGNVIRTDEFGDGELKIDMPWCPTRECKIGQSVDCQMYFSVFHQANYIIYGGSFGAVFFDPSLPAGVIGSNILWFPLFGELQQLPLNRFRQSNCRSRQKQERSYGYDDGYDEDESSESYDDALMIEEHTINGGNSNLYNKHVPYTYKYTIGFEGITTIQIW
eukprot:CAMPEP_0201569318 /NCGR_PEP_ID=MMETSP0190_2-20130828/10944_1 /ASSEMBLY_ACC=CAM_ASM_000263 /TAXON_ID=37353 /ORGANISM="Rosalina sp." /LENGTH=396 /DNA_ID=CAMNT_0047991515 /DNA_START=37 /DNA_END=1224 /DNA_ORIENTATION=+